MTEKQLKVVRNDEKINELNSAVDRVKAFQDKLNRIVLERNTVIDTSVTGIIAGQNVMLLGPPGTAKSYFVNAISQALKLEYFEIVMNPTTEPNELLGGYDLAELAKGKYVRQDGGSITKAEIAFLDEAFKCNSACLNLLLPILNERRYKCGDKMVDLPIVSIFGASNETPSSDENLEAMYDRWQIKHWVKPMSRKANVKKVMWSKIPSVTDVFSGNDPALTMQDIMAIRSAAELVTVSSEIEKAAVAIRDEVFKQTHLMLSDRKMVQWAKFLKADAAKKGKTEVTTEELFNSVCLLWDSPDKIETITKIVGEIACPWVLEINSIKKVVNHQELELDRWIDSNDFESHSHRQEYINGVAVNLSMELDRIEQVRKTYKGKPIEALDDLEDKVKMLRSEALNSILS